jgi:hypothetical protein
MRTISIRLDDHSDSVLTAFCERHRLTQTDALKAAIEHLAGAHRPTPAELASRFGLIGGFRSAERDLAEHHSQRVKQRLRSQRERDSMAPEEPARKSVRRSASAR